VNWVSLALAVLGAFGVGTVAPDLLRRRGAKADEYRARREPRYEAVNAAVARAVGLCELLSTTVRFDIGSAQDKVGTDADQAIVEAQKAISDVGLLAGDVTDRCLVDLSSAIVEMRVSTYYRSDRRNRSSSERMSSRRRAARSGARRTPSDT